MMWTLIELGRTEGNEIIHLRTDDLEVTIKGGANCPALPFVRKGERDSSRALTFYGNSNVSSIVVAGSHVCVRQDDFAAAGVRSFFTLW